MAASTWQQVYGGKYISGGKYIMWQQVYGSKITGPQSADSTGSKLGQKALQATAWWQAYGSKITGPQSAVAGSKPGQKALQATASSNRFMAARVELLDHNLITRRQSNGLAGWVKG